MVMPAPLVHWDVLVTCSCPPPATPPCGPVACAAARGGCAVCRSKSGTAGCRHGAGATPCGHLSAWEGYTHTLWPLAHLPSPLAPQTTQRSPILISVLCPKSPWLPLHPRPARMWEDVAERGHLSPTPHGHSCSGLGGKGQLGTPGWHCFQEPCLLLSLSHAAQRTPFSCWRSCGTDGMGLRHFPPAMTGCRGSR